MIRNQEKCAIIKTGGKQYLVYEGQELNIEKISTDNRADLNFDQVLLIADKDKVEIGQPNLAKATVTAQIIGPARGLKIKVRKFRSKSRYHKTTGHRQHYAKIRITKINIGITTKSAKKLATN